MRLGAEGRAGSPPGEGLGEVGGGRQGRVAPRRGTWGYLGRGPGPGRPRVAGPGRPPDGTWSNSGGRQGRVAPRRGTWGYLGRGPGPGRPRVAGPGRPPDGTGSNSGGRQGRVAPESQGRVAPGTGLGRIWGWARAGSPPSRRAGSPPDPPPGPPGGGGRPQERGVRPAPASGAPRGSCRGTSSSPTPHLAVDPLPPGRRGR